MILSLCNNISPKLIPDDIDLFVSLLQSVFPSSNIPVVHEPLLVDAIKIICEQDYLEVDAKWLEKVLQLKQVLEMRHGVMMVGPSGSGKSTAWRCLLKGMQKVDGVKGDYYVIDPKAMKKDKLYGSLDPNTLEWTDGVFTRILRKIIENNNIRAESNNANDGENNEVISRRSWIIFDGKFMVQYLSND